MMVPSAIMKTWGYCKQSFAMAYEQCENLTDRSKMRRRKVTYTALIVALALLIGFSAYGILRARQTVLRIADWETGEIYLETPAQPGDEIFFGWLHSLEKIPWNEYYHVDENYMLVLDTISFSAFGAGIPHDRGATCRVENGLIYMEEINDPFERFVWLNSQYTREIMLNGQYLTCGSELPEHRKLTLVVERRGLYGR